MIASATVEQCFFHGALVVNSTMPAKEHQSVQSPSVLVDNFKAELNLGLCIAALPSCRRSHQPYQQEEWGLAGDRQLKFGGDAALFIANRAELHLNSLPM